MTRALDLIRTATNKLRDENMMQFLTLEIPNLLFLFWVLKSTLKKQETANIPRTTPQNPPTSTSWLSWRNRHDLS